MVDLHSTTYNLHFPLIKIIPSENIKITNAFIQIKNNSLKRIQILIKTNFKLEIITKLSQIQRTKLCCFKISTNMYTNTLQYTGVKR